MNDRIQITDFLRQADFLPVVDVRSPSEFRHGHIPGAYNIPLFSDDERARVGTLYKKTGKQEAFDEGLRIAGPKLLHYINEGRKVAAEDNRILMYCWRGGQRSSAMAWFFRNAGITTELLEGGYKSYRRYLRYSLSRPVKMLILGGMTGSGKTKILHEMAKRGEQVIDLESIANHRGSVFGGRQEVPQPTTEQFENNLFGQWLRIKMNEPVWLEDESKPIGSVFIPDELFFPMKTSPLIELEVPATLRIRNLVQEYSQEQKDVLINNVLKIKKRLGGKDTEESIRAITAGDYEKAAAILLRYYDKAYRMSMNKNRRKIIIRISLSGTSTAESTEIILETIRKRYPVSTMFPSTEYLPFSH